jgi:rubrerythrin
MGNIFAGSEVVEIGIQIEKNGRDFYNTLAVNSKNQEAVKIFKFLSQEEERHIKVFEGILGKAEKYEPAGIDADEYYAYMHALASEYVFTQKDKGSLIAKKVKNDNEAVDMGIGFERDSIIFYEGIKRTVPDYDRKIIDELIAQEQKHMILLMEIKKRL